MVFDFLLHGKTLLVSCCASRSKGSQVYASAVVNLGEFFYPCSYQFYNFSLVPSKFKYFCSYILGLSKDRILEKVSGTCEDDEEDLMINFEFS